MPDLPPRQLITSLYGLYAREEDNWLSVAALVRLMADLGVDAAAVRSSVSRLKKRDVLRSHRRDGRAGYALSPATVAVLAEGDARIFGRRRATVADGWLVVVFSVPESQRERRHALRSQLVRLGFGSAAPGVWIAPGTLYDETARVLDRLGLSSFTEFFRGDYLGSGDPAMRMARWWDLGELDTLYAEFSDTYQPLQHTWSTGPPAPEVAFEAYVPMLTAWRRLPYLDPGLPLALLPGDWAGVRAEAVFAALNALLRDPAEKHARTLLRA